MTFQRDMVERSRTVYFRHNYVKSLGTGHNLDLKTMKCSCAMCIINSHLYSIGLLRWIMECWEIKCINCIKTVIPCNVISII